MDQKKKNCELTSVDQLRPSPKNPRRITAESIAGLKVSLAQYGDIAGIVWNERTGELVAGHQRVRGLRSLYGDQLRIEDGELVAPTGERWPVRVVNWDDATAIGALVSANNPAIAGEFDDGLAKLLKEIEAQDAELFAGLRLDELVEEELARAERDPDEMPEELPDPVTKHGDVWVLGEHRLLCGDATDAEDVEWLMGTLRARMAFTDPPYNVKYEGGNNGKRDRDGILNDNLGEGFERFLERALGNILRVTDGAVYICMSSSELDTLQQAFRMAGGHWSTFLIWAKDAFTLGRSDYQRQFEVILYGWRRGAERFWVGDRNQGDVWHCDKPMRSRLHPTMKPVDLVLRAIRNSSEVGDLVVDLFGGSGSTLIAAEASERRCRMMELDPRNCDIIVWRWERFTGLRAERLVE